MSKKNFLKVNEHPESYDDPTPNTTEPLIDERFEIINGIRYEFTPSPTFNHQVLVTQLLNSLYSTCHPNGTIVVAPLDVYLDEDNIVQPDVIFIAHENSHIIKNQRVEGPPDLVVEILSPSTGKKDKVMKKELYERSVIKEYWIVDPVHYVLDQFVLEDQKYTLHASFGPGDRLTSNQIACISIDISNLFEPIIE